jgi:phospholipase D3/4
MGSYPLFLIFAFIVGISAINPNESEWENIASKFDPTCKDGSLYFVESMPLGVSIPSELPKISEALINLIDSATQTIDLCAMYITLWEGANYTKSGGLEGRAVFDSLMRALRRGVRLRIIQTFPMFYPDNPDTKFLKEAGATMGFINWPALGSGSGVLHNKFLIVDSLSLYMGSANFDWRSFTQVKELGMVIQNCINTAIDLQKVFDLYWQLKDDSHLPPTFPPSFDTRFTIVSPMQLHLNGQPMKLFFAASPKAFNPRNRTNDIDALVDCINDAKSYVEASVMDYAPITLFRRNDPFFWPELDNALRSAAFRGVKVKLLFSLWNSTDPAIIPYMVSLNALPNIEVRLMKIPDQKDAPVVPFTRVNHSKYLITESQIYVTTSNWTPDYFLFTGGVSVTILGNGNGQQIVKDIWDRDWNSEYSHPVSKFSDIK